jgi:hypothetical protein
LESQKELSTDLNLWELKLGCGLSQHQLVYSYGFLKQSCTHRQRMEGSEPLRDSYGQPSGGLKLLDGFFSQVQSSLLLQLLIQI